MNTPTNHEQLSKQEAEIWTLKQTMNSSQNKRVKYEHSYKPWTTLKTRGRNTNTPTYHEQLSKQEGGIWTLLQTMNNSQNKREEYEHSYKPWTTLKTRGRNMNTPTNHEQLSKQEAEIWTLLHLYKPWTALKLKAVWWIPKPLCPTVCFLRFMDHIWGFFFLLVRYVIYQRHFKISASTKAI
jgi:hypothetical protein